MSWPALHNGLFGTAILGLDGLVVAGSDARAFLSGQLSADIEAIEVGQQSWSLVLEPDGKLVALVRVRRLDEQTYVLDSDLGAGSLLAARLRRFCIRTKASIDEVSLLALRHFGDLDADGIDVRSALLARAGNVRDEICEQPGSSWTSTIDAGDHETWRIWHGLPRFGAEITTGIIPASLGDDVIAETVSFTKGCYTGQELVARLDARGTNIPFHLALVTTMSDASGLEPGTVLVHPDSAKAVGTVTSVAPTTIEDRTAALCYLHRSARELTLVLAPPLTEPMTVHCDVQG